MRIVFFGTPDYVLPILDAVNKAFKEKHGKSPIIAVVTQPPRPVGRQKLLKYSPVDDWAHKRDIPKYFFPEDLIKNNIKADLGILASYGLIIPKEVIKIFPHGILVIHPSLLPQFRGSSPVQAAVVTDTNPTGVTIFKMDEKLDHGPVVVQFKEDILPDDTGESLRDRLFAKSAEILVETIPPYVQGKAKPKPQDDAKATYTKMVKKEDGFVNLDQPEADQIERKLRAYTPWPGIWTEVKINGENKRLKILKLHLEKDTSQVADLPRAKSRGRTPGMVLALDQVQLEGKNKVTWKQFKEAYPILNFE